MSDCQLLDLPNELLFLIFSYVDIKDLFALRRTCRQIKELLECCGHKAVKHIVPLVTNMRDPRMVTRSPFKLSVFEMFRIEHNWRKGKFNPKRYLFSNIKYMPWLQLDSSNLWMSQGKDIRGHSRIDHRYCFSRSTEIVGRTNKDVVRFKAKNDLVVIGKRDGGLCLWSQINKGNVFEKYRAHESDVSDVDIANKGTILLTCGHDQIIKIWKQNPRDSTDFEIVRTKELSDKIWCGSFSEDESSVAVGTTGYHSPQAITVFDSERLSERVGFSTARTGFGVLDFKWDGPNSIISCSFDGHIRRWDLRTGTHVADYEDPHNNSLYSLDTDYYNTIIAGCQLYGRIALWDMRQPKCVQLFFARRLSPVYSVSFNTKCIYAATDQNLVVFDFSLRNRIANDYSALL